MSYAEAFVVDETMKKKRDVKRSEVIEVSARNEDLQFVVALDSAIALDTMIWRKLA
jgi:hypothetical protein